MHDMFWGLLGVMPCRGCSAAQRHAWPCSDCLDAMNAAGEDPRGRLGATPPGVRAGSPETLRSTSGSGSARTDAIAKLRRAASQREIRRISPRSVRVHKVDAAPQVVQLQPPMLAAPVMHDIDGSVYSEGSEPRTTPWLTPSPSGDVQRSVSSDQLTTPHPGESSPLPSLDQLRRKILQERKTTGLSRSASASATSRVARAYTMQKLMGATTPVPYNDMFAFVRSVNEARSAQLGDTSQTSAGDVSIESDTSDATQEEEATPPRDPKRATLMRSVSAREVARKQMFQKIVRREGNGDARKGTAPSTPTTPSARSKLVPRPAANQPAPHEPSNVQNAYARLRADSDKARPVPEPAARLRSDVTHSAFSDSSSSTQTTDTQEQRARASASLRGPAHAPAENEEVLNMLQGLSSQLDAEAREARARRTRKGAGYLARAVSAGSAAAPSAKPGTEALQALGKVQPSTPIARTGTMPSRPAPMGLGIEQVDGVARDTPLLSPLPADAVLGSSPRPDNSPRTALERTPTHAEKPLPAPPTEAPRRVPALTVPHLAIGAYSTPDSPAMGTWHGMLHGAALHEPNKPRIELHDPVPSASPLDDMHKLEAPLLLSPRTPSHRSGRSVSGGGRSSPMLVPSPRSASAPHSSDAPPLADPPKKEGRGARLLGSLRRKTSRTRLADKGRAATIARTPDARTTPEPVRSGIVCLQGDESASIAARTVVLPTSTIALARLCTELSLSSTAVLARFPAEVPYGMALDPPRRLLRLMPVLQSAGEAYVKLRYLYIFSDTLVLAKPMNVPTSPEELSAYMLRQLHSTPDLGDGYVPLAILPLRHTRLVPGAVVRSAATDADRVVALRHLDALQAHLGAALPALLRELRRPVDVESQARLMYLLPELSRTSLSHFLYEPAHRPLLEAYVAQHRLGGLSLEAALRVLLLDLRFPTALNDFEVMLLAFAAHWLRSNRADLPPTFTLELATDVTFALLALNDALHGDANTPGLFARRNPNLLLDQFVQAIREQDAHHALSDRELRELFMAIKTCPLAQAAASDAPRRIVFHAAALAEGLVTGVPSAPISVALDAPDADLRIKLQGKDLYFDPPVLTFAHAATAEFTVCSTAPGEHDLVFVRLGANAPLYPPTSTARGPWQALPRSLPLSSEAHTARPALALQHCPPDTGPTLLQLYLADSQTAHFLARLLRERLAAIDAADNASSMHNAVHTLAEHVLHTALFGEGDRSEGMRRYNTLVQRGAACTGQDLVRTVRENSLLHGLLGEPTASG